jgi:ribonuclease J
MFDFGQSFTFGANYFTGYLTPRAINGLGDYFAFDLLPRIEGLYSKEMLTYCDLPYCKPKIDAVFLSHAHFDHISHIQFLDPDLQVYMGYGTKLFMDAMEETSSFCNYGEHPCNRFRTGDKIKIGNITVEPVHVDHSIPAAYGFIIHTTDGAIIYTGDLRRHGPRKDLTEDFIEKAKAAEPIAMICEGTRMVTTETRQNYSEPQVRKQAHQVVSSTGKMVFATRYSRDIDRFNSFYTAAKKTNRKLVITPKTAHLLTKLLDDKHLSVPNPLRDKNILVYYKRKRSGSFDDKDYYLWERPFMDKMATHEYIHKHQKSIVMDLDFYQFTELIDIKPDAGSHFIHSMSEPFSEEDIEDQVMHNWINHFKMQFHQMHASGHMNKQQLAEMINYIQPKLVFPVHTENQLLFKSYCSKTQMIEQGRECLLK